MADLLSFAPVRVFDDNGDPGAGYKASFYRSGTTSAVTVYARDGVTVLEQPVEADAEGVFPAVLFQDAGAVKAVITDASDATVYTVDPVVKVPAGASGASEVTFAPTVDLPYTNVQAAIEGAAASAASGFAAYGIGITGTGPLLADLDATGAGSGAYRFDGTTTGTFPSGVTASDTGVVEIWRETSGDAVMMLYSGAANASYMRRLAASTWGSWTKILLQSDVLDEDDMASDSATRPPSQQSAKAYVDGVAIGVGQAWQNLTASRSAGTSYQNTTGRPIMVAIRASSTSSSKSLEVSVDNSTWIEVGLIATGNSPVSAQAIVPDNYYYRATSGTPISTWAELR